MISPNIITNIITNTITNTIMNITINIIVNSKSVTSKYLPITISVFTTIQHGNHSGCFPHAFAPLVIFFVPRVNVVGEDGAVADGNGVVFPLFYLTLRGEDASGVGAHEAVIVEPVCWKRNMKRVVVVVVVVVAVVVEVVLVVSYDQTSCG